ncbi:MAG: hypothetical protein ACI85O_003666 [Saprospiraceae bacterium]|jgi:hypothetical protein
MRSLAFFLVVLLFTSCEKEIFQEAMPILKTPKARGTNIARVQNDFMRMLSNSAMTTLLEPRFYGQQSNSFNPSVSCVNTNYTSNQNVLDINFDTLSGSNIPCILSNGAKMHGDLSWNLNWNPNVWTTRECQPGFLAFNSIYCDGTIIEELRGENVTSPKFFVNTGCPSMYGITEPIASEIALNFKVSDDFLYKITSESGRVTFIDPVPSPGSFATLTTDNNFDSQPNFNDLYERSYQLDINVPDTITFCPFTEVQVFEPDNTSNTPDDIYTMMTSQSLIFTPFSCKHITSGMLELRSLPSSCTGTSTASSADLLMSIDFSVNAAGTFDANEYDGYIYICDYSANPSSPTCELKNIEEF